MDHGSNRRVFVVLAKDKAKIWKDNFEPNALPITITDDYVDSEYRKETNQFWSGRNRSQLNPQFAQKIAHEISGYGHIYLVGSGKGKASARQNFLNYLKDHHMGTGLAVAEVLDLDVENMTNGELLSEARKMVFREVH